MSSADEFDKLTFRNGDHYREYSHEVEEGITSLFELINSEDKTIFSEPDKNNLAALMLREVDAIYSNLGDSSGILFGQSAAQAAEKQISHYKQIIEQQNTEDTDTRRAFWQSALDEEIARSTRQEDMKRMREPLWSGEYADVSQVSYQSTHPVVPSPRQSAKEKVNENKSVKAYSSEIEDKTIPLLEKIYSEDKRFFPRESQDSLVVLILQELNTNYSFPLMPGMPSDYNETLVLARILLYDQLIEKNKTYMPSRRARFWTSILKEAESRAKRQNEVTRKLGALRPDAGVGDS